MSLINEALKKAQSKQGPPPVASASTPDQPPQPQPKPKSRRRSFFWGFLAALLMVSIVSMLSITVLTKVLLSDGDGGSTQAADNMNALVDTVRQATGSDSPEGGQASRMPTETPAVPERTGEEVAAGSIVVADEPAAAPEPTEDVQPEPPLESELPEAPARPGAAVDVPALHALEIRGIMSAGSRVLIFEPTTNRSRPYSAGQALESLPDWTIAEIQSASILLRHHDGTEFNKSF